MNIREVREGIFADVVTERKRQDEKWSRAPGWWLNSEGTKAMVLMEEVGEVCRAVLDKEGMTRLRKELIEVAATAVCWIETLDRIVIQNMEEQASP